MPRGSLAPITSTRTFAGHRASQHRPRNWAMWETLLAMPRSLGTGFTANDSHLHVWREGNAIPASLNMENVSYEVFTSIDEQPLADIERKEGKATKEKGHVVHHQGVAPTGAHRMQGD